MLSKPHNFIHAKTNIIQIGQVIHAAANKVKHDNVEAKHQQKAAALMISKHAWQQHTHIYILHVNTPILNVSMANTRRQVRLTYLGEKKAASALSFSLSRVSPAPLLLAVKKLPLLGFDHEYL